MDKKLLKIKQFGRGVLTLTKFFFIGFGIFLAHAFTYGISSVFIFSYLVYKRARRKRVTDILREVGLDDKEIKYIISKMTDKAKKEYDYELEKNEGEVVRIEE